jgi:hypothetical protein
MNGVRPGICERGEGDERVRFGFGRRGSRSRRRDTHEGEIESDGLEDKVKLGRLHKREIDELHVREGAHQLHLDPLHCGRRASVSFAEQIDMVQRVPSFLGS